MRWPWQRHRPADRADAAIAESTEQRKTAEGRREEVSRLAATLRQIRQENHFADSIRDALGEGR
jgi:hypothetical protein